MRVDDDHGVRAIFVALPAVVFDGLAGAVLAGRRHRTVDLTAFADRLTLARSAMSLTTIRPATIADIPHIVSHREQMFRDMGIPAEFEDMAAATDLWLRHALPSHIYRGWMATAPTATSPAAAA